MHSWTTTLCKILYDHFLRVNITAECYQREVNFLQFLILKSNDFLASISKLYLGIIWGVDKLNPDLVFSI